MGKVVAITIYYDSDSGELAGVTESPQFKRINTTVRREIWEDVQAVATKRHEDAIKAQQAEFERMHQHARGSNRGKGVN